MTVTKATSRSPWPRHRSAAQAGLEEGFRSGLEEQIAGELAQAGVDSPYESVTIAYEKPARVSKYTPDFPLPNGIVVETKGRFVTADRQKHLLVKKQHPDIDIRFVFSRAASRISKTSKTTYADWCRKHGFQFSDKSIPQEWLDEPPCDRRIAALEAATVRKK